jgi:hypothetical protein
VVVALGGGVVTVAGAVAVGIVCEVVVALGGGVVTVAGVVVVGIICGVVVALGGRVVAVAGAVVAGIVCEVVVESAGWGTPAIRGVVSWGWLLCVAWPGKDGSGPVTSPEPVNTVDSQTAKVARATPVPMHAAITAPTVRDLPRYAGDRP